ncbi:MAG: BMP family ABC transporter substrate-binding protein [Sphaerochaetaceae bacterium]|jgi:basic membrane protein A|nr:BMP family ABC transporter substrate-binding protein [Candidatus Cloacimonadota bacterium]MDD4397669.1 BMP family ABC transporter substrate-binding protein [Sphaerochaetaceae bacterium]
MKKIIVTMLVCLLAIGIVFANGSKETAAADTNQLDVALLLNGTLGDKAFFDSANRGIQAIKDQLGCKTKVVEVGFDDSKWEPALRDLCDEKHDIIICGTWQMQEIVAKVAVDYPDQKVIVFDTSMDYANDAKGTFKNIYSIEYKQNDGSFLAGVLAASMSKTGIIGAVGGMDNTVILDFMVGYIQGARQVNPNIKILSSFVGNFSDSAKAKELTFAEHRMGADVVFNLASNAGEGILQASKEDKTYAIGVDSDQAMLYMDSDPELAKLIVSSMLKRVDQSLLITVKAAQEGTLAWGSRVALGISEDCIGLADNEVYQSVVPADVRALVSDYSAKIKSGEIKVDTAFGMTSDQIKAVLDKAAK